MMPPTQLVGLVVADDPVLPTVETRHGTIHVRRLYGIDQAELDRAETWSGASFTEEYRRRDPLLLTDLTRISAMADISFASTAAARAAEEGSAIPAVQLDLSWNHADGAIEIALPAGQSGVKLRDALRGRLKFGRRLLVMSRVGPIYFQPADAFGLHVDPQGLIIEGALSDPGFARYAANPTETRLRYVLS